MSEHANRSPEKVLIIAEESVLRSQLRRSLELLGFDAGEAANGEMALTRLHMVDYDAILSNLQFLEADYLSIYRQFRALYPRLPILILSAIDCVDNKVELLEAGVDDYIVRPLPERELAARLRSAIRRFRTPIVNSTERRLTSGDIMLDPAKRRVEKAGSEVALTPIEFRTLQLLMRQAGGPICYSTLLSTLWGHESQSHREHLRVVISALRKKLEDNPSRPTYLITHSHFGYSFRES